MMYFERIINLNNGTETIRNYTKEEIAEVENAKAEAAKRIAEIESKEIARTSAIAKLAALGLTPEEIAAL